MLWWQWEWPLNVLGEWAASICHSRRHLGTTQILTVFLIMVIKESNWMTASKGVKAIQTPSKAKQMPTLAGQPSTTHNCRDLGFQRLFSLAWNHLVGRECLDLVTQIRLRCWLVWKWRQGPSPFSNDPLTSSSQGSWLSFQTRLEQKPDEREQEG